MNNIISIMIILKYKHNKKSNSIMNKKLYQRNNMDHKYEQIIKKHHKIYKI